MALSSTPNLARWLDALDQDFEATRFAFEWEARLVEIAARLRDLLERYPRGWWNRAVMIGAPSLELPDVDREIRTPQSPQELQRRMIDRTHERAAEATLR